MPRSKRPRPNRIFELTRARKWKYADVAERVRAIAAARGDVARAKVHTLTINRLATGEITLTQDWMNLLGEVFDVPSTEIITAPAADNLRRVAVCYALQARHWRRDSELPAAERYDIMIRSDPALHNLTLYAGEIRGQDTNLRYSPGSLAILSKIEQAPGEIIEGRRYHVRVTRADGMIEDTIKLMTAKEGQYWLRPESDHPDFQEWLPLTGKPGHTVEIVGRVRGVFFRED
jgi:hypothetical protein